MTKIDQIHNLFATVERAKQQWEATVDALPELICMVDRHERIIRANRTIEQWGLGSITQISDRNLHSLLHPDCDHQDCYLLGLVSENAPERISAEDVRQFEIYDPHLARHLLIKISPIPRRELVTSEAVHRDYRQMAVPDEAAWAIIFHDISEQKRTLRSLQRHADRLKTINSISNSVLATDSPQEMVTAALKQLQSFLPVHQAAVFLLDENDSLRALAVATSGDGRPAGADIPLVEAWNNASRPPDEPYYAGKLAGQKPLSRPDKGSHAGGLSAFANLPLRIDGRWMGTLIAGTRAKRGFSIDDLRVLEEVADLLTVALNQSLLRQKLQETNGELQQILRSKQENMQDLSHELRSPLSLIHGFVDLLRDESLGPLTPKQQEALSVVESRGAHLLSMVERFLLLQTMGDRELELELVGIEGFLRDIVAPWKLPARNRGVRLALNLEESLPSLYVDRGLLSQVISNLLDNALKFTPSGAAITVTGRSTDAEVIIEVADEGAGIASSRQKGIFERYAKGPGSGGAGIGLALCREVMEAHGGSITVASPGEGKGSTFTVRLPFKSLADSADFSGIDYDWSLHQV